MKVKINKVPNNRGFSLIELLVTLVVSGLVMSSVYSLLYSQQKSFQVQEQVVEMNQGLRSGLDLLLYELRMAGYDPDGLDTAGFTVANQTSVAFTIIADDDGIDNDNADGDDDTSTGADEPGELKAIQYDLYDAYGDGDNDLGRQVGASANTKRVAIENIEDIEFLYFDEDGNAAGALDDIRRVDVAVLARANRIDRNYTDTNVYYTATGDVDWGPYNDGYRRKFYRLTVMCRNMGL